MCSQASSRKVPWFLRLLRVLLVSFLLALLSFTVCLLLGILGTLLAAKLRGIQPDMTFAYRHVALPVAAMVAAVVLVSAGFMEARHYRQAKTLSQIERAS